MLFNILGLSFEAFRAIMIALVILAVICAVIVTIVVLIQPSNSNGISALSGGATDTFYSKNKSKSLQSVFKKMTVVCIVVLVVIMVTFALLLKFGNNIVG